jgi:hypothetical protein
MRKFGIILCGFAAFALPGPAWAGSDAAPAAKASPDFPDASQLETVPSVNPGDQIGIACDALTMSDADSDVRVVLTISALPGDAGPGYRKVLATDEQVSHGAVRVRIPSAPDLENQTVNVDVYIIGDKDTQRCDAGRMKIVRSPTAPTPQSVG